MNILALDTAMNSCSVAVSCEGQTFVRHNHLSRGQAEKLVPLIDAVMQEAGIAFADLDVILTTIGPGTFTGVRIGMATAKTLGLALDIPVYGLSTLEILAFQEAGRFENDTECLGVALIESKRSDFYIQAFSDGMKPLSDPEALDVADIIASYKDKKCIFFGDAVARFQKSLEQSDFDWRFNAEVIIPDLQKAIDLWLSKKGAKHSEPSQLEPLYLRPADVSTPKKVRTIK